MWVIYCLFDVMYSTYCLIFPLTLLNICISTENPWVEFVCDYSESKHP